MGIVNVLYVTRNGLLEPLGQSQVLSYLLGLSHQYRISVISYEKADDMAVVGAFAALKAQCEGANIRWMPQHFLTGPRVIAPLFSMLRMIWLIACEIRRSNIQLIHARSYIPAFVAMVVGRLMRVPFLFDMRALWPEELITSGRLKRGSTLHRSIVWAERSCLGRAAGVVSLTHAAVSYLKQRYPAELSRKTITVIPTCADLDRFVPAPRAPNNGLVHGCIGTILSGWFRTDLLAAWFAVAAERDPSARFDIITRDDPAQVRFAIDPDDRLGNRLTISARQPKQMPEAIQTHNLSIMFFTDGLSKLGSSPTRMAEVLGSGLPVIANRGVGDVAEIIEQNRVGVLIDSSGEAAMKAGLAALQELLADPQLPSRCRAAAVAVFSLDAGTRAYAKLYSDVLGERNIPTVFRHRRALEG